MTHVSPRDTRDRIRVTDRATPERHRRAGEVHRLRVVMLINRLNRGGGAERAMVALAGQLPDDEFDVTVVTTRYDNGPLLDAVIADGLRHISLGRRGRFDLLPFRRLVRLLQDEQIDVIHGHMFGSNFWAAVLGRTARVPVVVAHEQTWSYEGQRLRKLIDGRVIGRLADAFIAVSERDRDRMIGIERVPPEKVVLLPNPYVRRSRVPSVDIRQRWGIPREAPVIATVAVLRPQKALDVLLAAFADVLAAVPDAMLLIGGDGECRTALEQQAEGLRVSERVRFLGWVEDVGGVLAAADVATMSSDFEGAPLFALECAAHLTPLVSTDVGNVGLTLGADEGVVLVPPRNSRALAHALIRLLRDPQRRKAQAEAARVRLPRYELNSVAAELGHLYKRLV